MGGMETTKSCLARHAVHLFPSDELRGNFCLFVQIGENRNDNVPNTNFNPRSPSEKYSLILAAPNWENKNEGRKDKSNFFNNYVDRDLG